VPSRRTVIRSLGVSVLPLIAGCSSANFFGNQGVTGHIELKQIRVETALEEGLPEGRILTVKRLKQDDGTPYIDVGLADAWADDFENPRHPVVSDELATTLEESYESVRYYLGVESPAWDTKQTGDNYNAWASRQDFNQAQVSEQVRVTKSQSPPRIRIHSVEKVDQ